MVSEDVTKPAELSGTLVGATELEGPSSSHGIQGLQPSIVPQNVQHCTVCLPQELEPGSDMLAIDTVLQTTL